MSEIRILEICTVPFGENGIVRFLTRILSAMDRQGLRVDFACFTPPEPEPAGILKDMGCAFHLLPDRNRRPAAYFFALRKLIRRERYDIVHVHGNSATMAIELWAARIGGAKRRIAHSHNSLCLHTRLNRLLAPLMKSGYTEAMACSDAAANWLFPGKPCAILKNCVDTGAAAYSPESRAALRRELGFGSEPVIGMVAGFVAAKNHAFMLDVFRLLSEKRPDFRLMLVGDGPLLETIREKARAMGSADRICFTGPRSDVPALLSAMDIGVLPSLHEGLPAAALEYQCAGMPALLSDAVSPEAAPAGSTQRLPLDAEIWADTLAALSFPDRAEASRNAVRLLTEGGYSLKGQADALRQIYRA